MDGALADLGMPSELRWAHQLTRLGRVDQFENLHRELAYFFRFAPYFFTSTTFFRNVLSAYVAIKLSSWAIGCCVFRESVE